MKKRIYIETTVVSYFTAKPSREVMVAGQTVRQIVESAGYERPEICSPEELLEVDK